MGTILVREAVRRISVQLQDIAPQFERWPETEIIDWLNDAQLAICKFLPAACSGIYTWKLTPGTTLQSIADLTAANVKLDTGATPAQNVRGVQLLDLICNMGADGATPGKSIRLITDGREVLDTQNPNWHTIKSTALTGYVYDPRTPKHFHANPAPHAVTAVWVRGSLVAEPARIPNSGSTGAWLYEADGEATTVISVSDEFIDDLVNYVCARAYMKNTKNADPNKAGNFTAMFTGSLNAKVTALTGNNPNLQRLPFAPEPIGAAS